MPPTASTVYARGLRETIRAFNRLAVEVGPEIKRELLDLAEPVAVTARGFISRYTGASTQTIGPRSSTLGAYVTQRARKVTGQRGDFGTLQQRRMEEALEQHVDDIGSGLEDALDRLTTSNGF